MNPGRRKCSKLARPVIERLETRTLLSAAVTAAASNSYSSAPATARWDTVPNQTFSTELDAGVVAFQGSGINHVSFTVNGGAPVSVTKITLNPQTNVWEYVMPLLASHYADGAIQLSATAYPTGGLARALPAITLFSDAGNSLPAQTLWVSATAKAGGAGTQQSPFSTIEAATEAAVGGATIYLLPGTYTFSNRGAGYNENSRWITIEPAPGVSRSQVIVQPNGGVMRVYDLALENLTLIATHGADITGWNYADNAPDSIWVDNCDISSPAGMSATEISQPIDDASWTHKYVTNTSIHDYPGRGLVNVELARNDKLSNLGDDAIDIPGLVVNTTIDNVIAITAGEHIDGIQWWNSTTTDSNSIVYGVSITRVDGQLLFGTDVSNVAVVNFFGTSLQGGIADPSAIQWARGDCDNLMFDHLTVPNQSFYFIDDVSTTQFANDSVTNSVLWRLFATQPAAETITNCRVMDVSEFKPTFGDYTTGDPDFNNPGTGDYRPAASSVLAEPSRIPDVPADVLNVVRAGQDAIGAYAAMPSVSPPVVQPPVVDPPVVEPPVVDPPVVDPPVVDPPVAPSPVVPPVTQPPTVGDPQVSAKSATVAITAQKRVISADAVHVTTLVSHKLRLITSALRAAHAIKSNMALLKTMRAQWQQATHPLMKAIAMAKLQVSHGVQLLNADMARLKRKPSSTALAAKVAMDRSVLQTTASNSLLAIAQCTTALANTDNANAQAVISANPSNASLAAGINAVQDNPPLQALSVDASTALTTDVNNLISAT